MTRDEIVGLVSRALLESLPGDFECDLPVRVDVGLRSAPGGVEVKYVRVEGANGRVEDDCRDHWMLKKPGDGFNGGVTEKMKEHLEAEMVELRKKIDALYAEGPDHVVGATR